MRPEAVDPDAARPELRGEKAGEGFDRRASDAVAEEPGSRHARPRRRQGQDHAPAHLDHVPCRGLRGDEVGPRVARDRQRILLERQLREGRALDMADSDRVEHDVDAARPGRDGIGVRVHRSIIERVELRGLGHASSGRDVLGHGVELREGAAGEEYLRALPGEGPGDSAADGASGSVDQGGLVLEDSVRHEWVTPWWLWNSCRYPLDDRALRRSTWPARSGRRGWRGEAERAESIGVVRDRTHLDSADPRTRYPRSDPDGLGAVLRLDEEVAADQLLRFRKRPVARRRLAFSHANGGGSSGGQQPIASDKLAALPQVVRQHAVLRE